MEMANLDTNIYDYILLMLTLIKFVRTQMEIWDIGLKGAIIFPGFINIHVHADFKYLGGQALRDFQKEYLKECIKESVTTVGDERMFTDDTIDTVVEKRNLYKNLVEFPRIITTGKFFLF